MVKSLKKWSFHRPILLQPSFIFGNKKTWYNEWYTAPSDFCCNLCGSHLSNFMSNSSQILRAIASNWYGESHGSSENSDSFIASKRPFWWTIFRNILSKFQRVHIFVKSGKIRNTAQSTRIRMADGSYPKIVHFQHGSTERRELARISYSHSL